MNILLLAATPQGLTWSLALDFVGKVVSATAWPIAAVLLALLFHKEIRRILAQLSSFKAAGVEAEFRDEVASMGPLVVAPGPLEPLAADANQQEVDDPGQASRSGEAPGESTENNERSTARPAPLRSDDDSSESERANFTDPESPMRALITTMIRWQRATDKARAQQLQTLLDVGGPETVMRLKDARDMAEKSPASAVLMAWSASERVVRQFLQGQGFTVDSISRGMRDAFIKGLVAERVYDRYQELKKLRDSVAHAEGFSGEMADVIKYIGRVEDFIISIGNLDRFAKLSDGA